MLTERAVETRYPGDWDEATEGDAVSALENAEIIVNEINSILQLTNQNVRFNNVD